MDRTTKIIVSVIFIGIIYVVAIILIVLGVSMMNSYNVCTTYESPACFQITCTNTTSTCEGYAYRCLSDGRVLCSYDPLNPQEDKEGLCKSGKSPCSS